MAGKQIKQSKLIASLLKPDAYPHPVSSIELLETHISWVILTGTYAYKIKKSLRLDFLDFSTLQLRQHFCEEELRLNRRMAPMLYLGVVPVCGSVEHPVVDGEGKAIEYALKMRQFPQSAQLDKQLDAGLLNVSDMHALADTIASYHRDANIIDYRSDAEAFEQVAMPMRDNLAPISALVDMKVVRRIEEWTETSLQKLEGELIERRKDGFVRECHGDLHLANLVRLPTGIVAFDCVEFSAALRNIDVISDVAFLVMDLIARARQDLAAVLINRYLERTGDYPGMRMFGLYFVYHCMIRAKVAAVRSDEIDGATGNLHEIEQLKHYLAVALRWIKRPKPRLIAMHGYSGSGKTWLSSTLLAELPAIRVRSDIERQRETGVDEITRKASKPGQGAYTDHARSDVYRGMMDIVGTLLEAGYNVIADASFLNSVDRDLIVALAEKKNVPLVFVDAHADEDELKRRLRDRSAAGDDVSEADVQVLLYQQAHASPLTVKEQQQTVCVATDGPIDPGSIIKEIRQIS